MGGEVHVKIKFQYPVYPDLTYPNGFLPDDKRAQACWYFYTIAQHAKETVGEGPESQIILEGELWMDKRYEQQARTVATMYQLESPDEMFKFWNQVQMQALSLGLPQPAPEYMRPLKLVRIH